MSIAFLGIDKMGLPMSGHLARAGHAVRAYDAAAGRLDLAAQAGVVPAASLAEAVGGADVIISSLPNDAALESVAAQVCKAAARGAVYVDTSIVSLEASARVAALCEAAGIDYLRLTVSGNNKMAEAANLTIMASGPRARFDALLPLFKTWGASRFYLGEGEQARLMKLVVNLMIVLTSTMLAEALTLGEKGGLDWRDMWSVITASAVGSPIVKAKSAQLVERDFSPTFTVEQMQKDVSLILGAGHQVGAPMLQAALATQALEAAHAQGHAQEDYAAVIKVMENMAGLDG
ncbi:MAG: NAD(P)-dependent oxidoreductase [Candidatus Protistobacter heckmanni]|nr:NAD(P)-dependent oxidoreductase [Candidatus Protistobacter heckmanni]